MDQKEIKAYLNYEDVQKELETAKELIKKLLPIAERTIYSRNEYLEILDRAKQFLK